MFDRAAISIIAVLTTLLLSTTKVFAETADIQTAHHSPREQQEKLELDQLLKKHDVSKYTFTRTVVIEERAMNHAFPVLTLNVHFLGSDDELLSSFLHEQLHWYLHDHPMQMEQALSELRRFYPKVPAGLPEGADTLYSTYGHLVDCYLEIQADRQIIGPERTDRVIKNKPWYTWIYKTITEDEKRIAGVVNGNHLEIQ
jgi:hypothetical protein